MRLDLHVHTTASDGAWTAQEVVAGAVRGRLDAIAIADHDTTLSVGPAVRASRDLNLQIIPAVELSSTSGARELHILGYFIDPSAKVVRVYQDRARTLRESRMEEMVALLAELGIRVDMAEVRTLAGSGPSILARPHLARALVSGGHAHTLPEAFDRYIGDQAPAFVPTRLQSPEEAIEVVLESGGCPVWAHPPGDLVGDHLDGLVEAGLRGLEIYRPNSPPSVSARLRRLADHHDLLVSGGSDWHGPERNDPLGTFFVTSEEVSALLEQGGI